MKELSTSQHMAYKGYMLLTAFILFQPKRPALFSIQTLEAMEQVLNVDDAMTASMLFASGKKVKAGDTHGDDMFLVGTRPD